MSMATAVRASLRMPFSGQRRSAATTRIPRVAVIGAVTVVVLYLAAVVATRLAPADALAEHLSQRLQAPSLAHPFGTDGLGHDELWQIVAGARWTLPLSILAMLLGAAVGVPSGVSAAWARGRVEAAIMRAVDAAQAFPFIVLAIAVIAVLHPGFVPLLGTLAFGSFIAFARTSYVETRRVASLRYVEASVSLGIQPAAIVLRHILRNIRQSLLVVGAFTIADVCIAEAGLSFLGVGAPGGTISWGKMLATGQPYMQTAWWLVVAPAGAIMVIVLLCNYIGDSLDPQ